MATKSKYNWKYCSLGGVTRVNIATGDDIAHLNELDKKMWTVLSCPTKGLEIDERTLTLLDTDNDGKIRIDEIVAASQWLTTVLNNPDLLLKGDDTLSLSAFNTDTEEGRKLQSSAQQILKNLGLEKDAISITDTTDRVAIFAQTKFNGDGIITPTSSDDETVQKDITSCIETMGACTDRSGEDGVNVEKIEAFYNACTLYAEWMKKGEDNKPAIFPYAENTAAAYAVVNQLNEKVNDFYMRCNFIAFDENCAAALDVSADKVATIGGENLSQHSEEIAAYPLARPNKEGHLPIHNINPAWQATFAQLKTLILDIDYANKEYLTQEDWQQILHSFDAYCTWQNEKAGTEVESLGYERIQELLAANNKETMLGLVEKDVALTAEAESIEQVDKLLHLYRDFYHLLRNYVIFTDFYDRSANLNTTFQAGKLFIDQRSCDLCIRVEDMGKHANIAAASGMFLIYCHCTSKVKNAEMDIAAVLTKGDIAGLYEGQNAIFYDRDNNDWDAVVTKIVDNPISVGHAFWTPYRKLGKLIGDQIDKMAAEKDEKANSDLSAKVNLEALPTAPAADGAAAATAKPPFDIAKFAGIFAAIGLALSAIGLALKGIVQGFVHLTWWQQILTIVIVLLVISGPAMFIAWRKLKNRNLGPVLNANGWAINSKIIVNSRFGSTLTHVAKYPTIKTDDPYVEKTSFGVRLLRWIVLLAVVGGLVWFVLCKQGKGAEPATTTNTEQVEAATVEEPAAAAPAAEE